MFVARNLSFGYGQAPQLFSKLCFEIQPGQIWHLKGDNGVGKTTLLKGLLGLVDLQFETLTLHGSSHLKDFRQNTTYIPAEGSGGLLSYLNATQNLKLFNSCSDHQLDQKLHDWGFITEPLRHYLKAGEFSTGMRKRLLCLRAQIQGKSLWLFDEPTHGLDQKGIQRLKSMIQKHQSLNHMMMFASHHHSFAQSIRTHTLDLGGYHKIV